VSAYQKLQLKLSACNNNTKITKNTHDTIGTNNSCITHHNVRPKKQNES
jgi:hypothetical protein